MNKKQVLVAVSVVLLVIAGLFSFKAPVDAKKVTLLKHYTASEFEANNAIVICTPDGKTKKFQLLPHKAANFEMNDKMLTQQLNALIETGLKMTEIESYGDRQLFITTYIFE